jgi:hypothetical protein
MLSDGENDYEKAIALCERERVRGCRNNPDDCHGDWTVSGNPTLDQVIGVVNAILSHFGKPLEAWLQET